MAVYIISFSPTGGTKKVADRLAKGLGTDVRDIDLTGTATDYTSFSFSRDDICIAAVPSFGGRVPAPAACRLSSMKAYGARAVLVAVYGNRAFEDTLLELKNILDRAGFRCTAAVAAVAEHSIMHQFASGRPDHRDMEELDQFARQIREALEKSPSPNSADLALPGNTPYREYHVIPLRPETGKDCVSCGLCAEKCPVGAIPAGAPDQTDGAACISCMRCVSICPTQARTLDRQLLAETVQRLKSACAEQKKNELFL